MSYLCKFYYKKERRTTSIIIALFAILIGLCHLFVTIIIRLYKKIAINFFIIIIIIRTCELNCKIIIEANLFD